MRLMPRPVYSSVQGDKHSYFIGNWQSTPRTTTESEALELVALSLGFSLKQKLRSFIRLKTCVLHLFLKH